MRGGSVFLWRRLDQPGHDSCRLSRSAGGWQLRGGAAFLEGSRPCHLAYEVRCDPDWRTRSARVLGHRGDALVDLRISRGARGWKLNGAEHPATKGCVDVDLAFTPATNLIAIRRLRLEVGDRADAPAAWLAFQQLRLRRLPQSYHRVGARRYAYEAPTAGYSGTLDVSRLGSIVRYPGAFEIVPR